MWRRLDGNLAVDIEAGVPGGLLLLEAALVLGGCRPGRVGRRRGHHHEERPVKLAPQEVHRHVGLRSERVAVNTTRLQTSPPRGRRCNSDQFGFRGSSPAGQSGNPCHSRRHVCEPCRPRRGCSCNIWSSSPAKYQPVVLEGKIIRMQSCNQGTFVDCLFIL